MTLALADKRYLEYSDAPLYTVPLTTYPASAAVVIPATGSPFVRRVSSWLLASGLVHWRVPACAKHQRPFPLGQGGVVLLATLRNAPLGLVTYIPIGIRTDDYHRYHRCHNITSYIGVRYIDRVAVLRKNMPPTYSYILLRVLLVLVLLCAILSVLVCVLRTYRSCCHSYHCN